MYLLTCRNHGNKTKDRQSNHFSITSLFIIQSMSNFHYQVLQIYFHQFLVCWFAWWCLTPLSTIFQLYHGGKFYVDPFEPHTNIWRHHDQLFILLNLMSNICRHQLLPLFNLIQISAGINCSPFWTSCQWSAGINCSPFWNSLYKYLPTSFNGWPFWTSCQSSAGIKTPQI